MKAFEYGFWGTIGAIAAIGVVNFALALLFLALVGLSGGPLF